MKNQKMYKVETYKDHYKVNIKPDAYNYNFWNENGHTRMSYNYNKNEITNPRTGQVIDLPEMEWFNLFLHKIVNVKIINEEIFNNHKTIYFKITENESIN